MNLWENYRKICFIAPFSAPKWPAYAIVTAWNPASRQLGMRRNTRRQRALWRAIAAVPRWQVMGPCRGSSLDESWQESSLLLASTRSEAIRLAARFGQNAIYWVEQGNCGCCRCCWRESHTIWAKLNPTGLSGALLDERMSEFMSMEGDL